VGEWGGNHNPRGINQYSGISGRTKRGTHLFRRDGSSVTISEVGKMKRAAPAKHPEGSVEREAQKTAGAIYNAKAPLSQRTGPSLPQMQAKKAVAKKQAAAKPAAPAGPKYSDAQLAAMTPQQRLAARREMGQISTKSKLTEADRKANIEREKKKALQAAQEKRAGELAGGKGGQIKRPPGGFGKGGSAAPVKGDRGALTSSERSALDNADGASGVVDAPEGTLRTLRAMGMVQTTGGRTTLTPKGRASRVESSQARTATSSGQPSLAGDGTVRVDGKKIGTVDGGAGVFTAIASDGTRLDGPQSEDGDTFGSREEAMAALAEYEELRKQQQKRG
jgi:hypothetical protein